MPKEPPFLETFAKPPLLSPAKGGTSGSSRLSGTWNTRCAPAVNLASDLNKIECFSKVSLFQSNKYLKINKTST